MRVDSECPPCTEKSSFCFVRTLSVITVWYKGDFHLLKNWEKRFSLGKVFVINTHGLYKIIKYFYVGYWTSCVCCKETKI